MNLLGVVAFKFHGHCLLTIEFDIIFLWERSRRGEKWM
jgi:hypothetical protein